MYQPSIIGILRQNIARITVVIAAALFLAVSSSALHTQSAGALSGSQFKAGDIIDDYTFYNKSSMSSTQIQNFLNAKVPSCDTQGKLPATAFGYPNKTRAQYAAMVGWQKPPYTCLRNYKQNTPQMEAASGLCEGISARTNRTGAQIIKDIADACSINPQVLLVLLEKEQSLITDTWPLDKQYKSATGFACPDTAPCDSSYGGFFYQVYYAARQFKVYKAFPDNYNYLAGRSNRIYYNPNPNCGSSNVYIQNQATAGLYNYTPYQPNASALKNLYGSGDSCGAYGNRNFWRLFMDWFGSTHGGITVSGISFESQPFKDKQTYVKLSIKNISKSTVHLGRIKAEARNDDDAYFQTPSVNDLSIKPGATYTFRQPITIPQEGDFTFSVARNVNNSWIKPPFNDFAITSTTEKDVSITVEPTIDQSLSLSEGTQHVGAPITATFRIKNNSLSKAVNVGRLKVQGDLNGIQYDFPSTASNLSIPAGQTYTYTQQFIPTKTGTYTFKIMNNRSEYGWSSNFPTSATAGITRSANVKVNDSVTITESLKLSKTSAHQGEQVTATFKIKNFSAQAINIGRMKVEGRLGSKQYDFPSTPSNLTLQPGEEYSYSGSRIFSSNGTYAFKLVNFRDAHKWSDNYPMNESQSIGRTANLSIKDPVTITEGLELSTNSSRSGDTVTATFTMKNFSNKEVGVGRTKVEGRLGTLQYDFPSTPSNLTLQPGEEYVYSKTLALSKIGTYTFKIINHRDSVGWSSNFPVSETKSVPRTANLTVKHAVTVTQGLSLSAATVSKSDSITATFKLKNFSTIPMNIGRMKVEAKLNNTLYSFPSTPDNLTLNPGEEYTYSQSRTIPKAGVYSLRLVNYRSWAGWSFEYPVSETSSIPRTTTITIN